MFRSIRFVINATILVALVIPVLISSSLFIRSLYKISSDAATQKVRLQAEGMTEKIEHKIELLSSRFKIASENQNVILGTALSVLGTKTNAGYQATTLIKKFLEDNPLVSTVFIMNNAFEIIDRVPEKSSGLEPISVLQHFMPALDTLNEKSQQTELTETPVFYFPFEGQDFLSESILDAADFRGTPLTSPIKSHTGIIIMSPLYDMAGDLRGFLVAVISVDSIVREGMKTLPEIARLDMVDHTKEKSLLLPGIITLEGKQISSKIPFHVKGSGNGQGNTVFLFSFE